MLAFFHLLFALRLGILGVPSTPPTLSIRAEARDVAETLHAAAPLEILGSPFASPGAAEWVPTGPAGGVGPVFHAYRPEDWVARVIQRTTLADLGVTKAAMWVLRSPVRVELRPDRFYVSYTVRAP